MNIAYILSKFKNLSAKKNNLKISKILKIKFDEVNFKYIKLLSKSIINCNFELKKIIINFLIFFQNIKLINIYFIKYLNKKIDEIICHYLLTKYN